MLLRNAQALPATHQQASTGAGTGASTHLETQEVKRDSAVRLAAVGKDPLALRQGEQQRAQLHAPHTGSASRAHAFSI